MNPFENDYQTLENHPHFDYEKKVFTNRMVTFDGRPEYR